MPRGRKRNPPPASFEEAEEIVPGKRDKPVEEEEIFVNIIDPDEPILTIKEEPGSLSGERFEEIPDSVDETAAGSSSSRTQIGKRSRRLPIPRLINSPEPEEIKPRKTTIPPARGARTRAMAVHDTMLESMKLPKTEETILGEFAEVEDHDCEFCSVILHSRNELLEHKKAFHKDQTEVDLPVGTLLCAHPHCMASFPDVSHLIAHLVAYHSQQQYRIRKLTFDSIDKFWNWKQESERIARCKFMGMVEDRPEDRDNDCIESTFYCEYCFDWRVQEEKGPPIAEQLPKKLIGCPAYYTATIDNRKEKAVVIGCFAHLGHHKKVGWTSVNDKGTKHTLATIKCDYCDMMFRSQSAATRHHRLLHQPSADADGKKGQSVPKQPSLECADPECDVMCDSMVTLVQHVAEAHKVDVSVDEYKFVNIEQFERWRVEMEQSTCSKFCKVSGRVLPNEVTKYFLCHLSGHTNRTKKKDYTPTEKQRLRPTKKMGRYCTAFMSFKESKIDNSVSVRGCLRHFGHPLEVRRLPLPDQVRKEVSDLLLKGLIEEEVVTQIRSLYNENERGHFLQRYEVRNIALKLQREGLILASKTYITSEEDGRMWDEMGFPEEAPFMQYSSLRRPKVVSYKSIHHSKAIPITDIHIGRANQPTHSRYISRPNGDQVEMVHYVDGDYIEEEELASMEDGEAVYFEQELEEEVIQDDDAVPMGQPEIEHQLPERATSSANPGGRKRMPLLKEAMRTGNRAFDDVMDKMKSRFNKISQQLKETQDTRLAHGMLKELKELQDRLGGDHNEMGMDSPWNDEYFDEDVDHEDYDMENSTIGHEEEVNEGGYDEDEYIDPSGEEEIPI